MKLCLCHSAAGVPVLVYLFFLFSCLSFLSTQTFIVEYLVEYNNRVYVRGHKYVLGPTQTHFSPSR